MFAAPPKICGVRLLPFSIGHFIVLKSIDNAALSGGHPAKSELLLAILACSLSFNDCKRIIIHRNLGFFDAVRFAFMHLRWKGKNLVTAWESFGVYLEDHLDMPRHKMKAGSSKPIKSDIGFYMIAFLMRNYGMTFDYAANTPFGVARCLMSASAEMDGDDTLLSAEEAEAFRLMDEGVLLDKQGRKDEAEDKYNQAQSLFNQAREQ